MRKLKKAVTKEQVFEACATLEEQQGDFTNREILELVGGSSVTVQKYRKEYEAEKLNKEKMKTLELKDNEKIAIEEVISKILSERVNILSESYLSQLEATHAELQIKSEAFEKLQSEAEQYQEKIELLEKERNEQIARLSIVKEQYDAQITAQDKKYHSEIEDIQNKSKLEINKIEVNYEKVLTTNQEQYENHKKIIEQQHNYLQKQAQQMISDVQKRNEKLEIELKEERTYLQQKIDVLSKENADISRTEAVLTTKNEELMHKVLLLQKEKDDLQKQIKKISAAKESGEQQNLI
ncbi:DNA-binding protein [Acinetobacter nectaris]|uniref:DNA-binding protein n=1 Tax=Acinetobacter nectaris TaxID=1219382 RepID=UPI001F3975FF|nr:DNA-binding protein [Acinetobacter nectaris]MCF9047102.1 DNA-binding protein [Acinetobacter nectaris]